MKHPPPATQEGADWFYRQLVQTNFMKLADETRISIGLETLHLIQDLLDQGFETWQFQEHRFNFERIILFLLEFVDVSVKMNL